MKKIIIIAAVILSSALTAYCFSSSNNKQDITKIKIEKSTFTTQSVNSPGAGLASAD